MHVGLDRLRDDKRLKDSLASGRFGLLSHPAAVDQHLTHISSVLEGVGLRPSLIFGPEHGYGGEAQDMVGVADATDPRSGARIVSLYGDAFSDLSPKAADLTGLDTLLVDMADVGSRYYTFIWSALLALRAANKAGVRMVLLDRPNPLGGEVAEGRLVTHGFHSFVGLESVPVRHALSIGEIVALFADREGLPKDALTVVSNLGWDRGSLAHHWDRPFVMTSPNMPTADTALVYPGGCLIEGTNLSEGRGTTRPFELVGAPFIDGQRLARDLADSGLDGFCARALTFTPTFHKHATKICGGVQIHVTDAASFRPYATYLALVAACQRQAPEAFRFRTERYEYVDNIPAFDLLTGAASARQAIGQSRPLSEWLAAETRVDPEWTEQSQAAQAAARSRAW